MQQEEEVTALDAEQILPAEKNPDDATNNNTNDILNDEVIGEEISPEEEEEFEGEGVPEENNGMDDLLLSIRQGVTLKRVPVNNSDGAGSSSSIMNIGMKQKRNGKPLVTSIPDELQWKLRKRNLEMEKSSAYKTETSEFLHSLTTLKDINPLRFSQLEEAVLRYEELQNKYNLETHTNRVATSIQGEMVLIRSIVTAVRSFVIDCNQTRDLINSQNLLKSKNAINLIDSTAILAKLQTSFKRLREVSADNLTGAFGDYQYDWRSELLIPMLSCYQDLNELLIDKAFNLYGDGKFAMVSKFDFGSRITNIYNLLTSCKSMSAELHKFEIATERLPIVDAHIQTLLRNYPTEIKVRTREGEWDKKELVSLSPVSKKTEANESDVSESLSSSVATSPSAPAPALKPKPPVPKKPTLLKKPLVGEMNFLQEAFTLLRSGNYQWVLEEEGEADKVGVREFIFASFDSREGCALISIELENAEVLQTLLQPSKEIVGLPQAMLDKLFIVACKNGWNEGVEILIRLGADVNYQSHDLSGNSALHLAARKKNLAFMNFLLHQGADPVMVNAASRTPLQLLVLEYLKLDKLSFDSSNGRFDFGPFLNNPKFSDITFITDDGTKFYAHKIVLCAQSSFFNGMFTGNWKESENSEFLVSSFSSRAARIFSEYLYTGRALFPRDDLQLGLELLEMAQLYDLPAMADSVEKVLTDRINDENVLVLYQPAYDIKNPQFFINVCSHILYRFQFLLDPVERKMEILHHFLENFDPSMLPAAESVNKPR